MATKAPPLTIVLTGFPNAGKTSLFNAISGQTQKTVNYPGSTVSLNHTQKTGPDSTYNLIDTPGITSLKGQSPDENITLQSILKGPSDVILYVVDTTQFTRQIPLAKQLARMGFRIVLALSKQDIMQKQQSHVDIEKLAFDMSIPVFIFNGQTGEGIQDITSHINALEIEKSPKKIRIDADQSFHVKDDFKWAKTYIKSEKKTTPIEWDQWILHPILGPLIFITIMSTFFFLIFFVSAPLINIVDTFIGNVIDGINHLLPASWVTAWLTDGLIAGIGAVLVFVPQILLLFAALGVMEESGYLARGAVLVDKPLTKLGMSGKSFVPLLSGCACAIPAMMAARTIPSKRERLV
ncbi:MAG: ferrous iron transporter B, partial [Candidatus Margulisbacteria bacterium]|nr:ferrous iron transporter B [Candidatus Margulisiibacteriota bacterium]